MQKGEMIACDCEVIHDDVVEQAAKSMLPEQKLAELADFFKIVADSTRAKILWALDNYELCVCDIAVLLGMTKSAVSHQLRVLRDSNLVKFRRDGKVVYYSLADDHVKEIFEMAVEHINE